jgi:putative iron-dependent peroxidase
MYAAIMASHLPQHGILRPQSAYHYFLEYKIPDGFNLRMAADAIYPVWSEAQPNSVPGISTQGGSGSACVLAFGARLWRTLSNAIGKSASDEFTEDVQSRTVKAVRPKRARALQPDLWIWLHADSHDGNFGRAMRLNDGLARLGAELLAEEPGFRAQDSRDLTGFIDGIGNAGESLQSGLAFSDHGASYLLVQRWIHDLRSFHRLEVSAQERLVGRRKSDGADLCHEYGYADSHVNRMRKILGYPDRDGLKYEDRQIVRRSVAVGTLRNPGLYFIGFFRRTEIFGELLNGMFDGKNGGADADRLLEFSNPRRTGLLYVPSVPELTDLYKSLPN